MTSNLLSLLVAAALTAPVPLAIADDNRKAAQSDGAVSADKANKSKGSASAGASASSNQPLVVLVPMVVASSSNFADGCWTRLYEDNSFTGNRLSLVGPVDMPNMRTAFGHDWSGNFESVEVGPKATLTVYDNENYQQKVATFKPGQKVADLDEKMGFFEQIRSVKIACAGGATAKSGKAASSSGASAGKADMPRTSAGK